MYLTKKADFCPHVSASFLIRAAAFYVAAVMEALHQDAEG